MDNNIMTSIISGIITIAISVTTTIILNRAALKKIRIETRISYSKSLFDKRLLIYPKLFNLLSGFNKLIEEGKQTRDDLIKLHNDLNEWNSENAIFLTKTSAKIAYGYRFYLIELLEKTNKEEITEKNWIDIRSLNVGFEKSIRAEIGIYNTDPVGKYVNTENLEKIYGDIINKRHEKYNAS